MEKKYSPSNPILIGSHHKTGTKLTMNIFGPLASKFGERVHTIFLNRSEFAAHKVPDAEFYFSLDSLFPDELLARDFRGLHMIRDPRDVILSGAQYHQISDEFWLHMPSKAFGGKTYKDAICDLPPEDRFEFEMYNKSSVYIKEIAQWNFDNPSFFEVKYEDFIADYNLDLFYEILEFLEMPKNRWNMARKLRRNNDLFSGDAARRNPDHVIDGRPARWAREMNYKQGIKFLEYTGELLIKLGYEKDDDWVNLLSRE